MMTRFDPSDSSGLGCLSGSSWQPVPPAALSPVQKDWLTRGGGLTQRLCTLGRVQVQVVDERVGQGWSDELACLGLSARTPVWVREVVLYVDQVALVAAHSITPLRASRGTWQAIRSLGTRPLAELLYADPSVERSVLVNRRLTARHPLHRYAARWTDARVTSLVARRSVFERHRTPLLVTECMLPALWQRLVAPHQTPTAHLHGAHHVGPVRLGTRLSQAPAKAQGAGEIADGPRRPR
jgi:chorismate lyase